MKRIIWGALWSLSSSVYATNLQSMLGVPLGITANDAMCGSGSNASATVAQVASFDAIIFQWSQMRDPIFRQIVIDRAAQDRQAGLKIMLGMSPTVLAGLRTDLDVPCDVMTACGLVPYSGCALNPNTASFSNTCLRNQFIADAIDYATAIKPDYFHLATEINFLLLRTIPCPGDVEFASMGTLYQAAYPAIKAVSPNSQLSVSFEYELQKGIDRGNPGSINANWDITLGAFRGNGPASLLDVVSFTTYPSRNGLIQEDYATPASIPADFYAAAAEHLRPGERAAFTEVGWPTLQPESEASQSDYLNRLPELMSVANPVHVTLALLHDVTVFGSSPLGTVGVRNCDGSPKLGWSILTGGPVAMNVSIYRVSDNSLDTQISWPEVTLPAEWVPANHYIRLDTTVTAATGGIQIYTDNTATDADPKYTGTISSVTPTPAGLVNSTNPVQTVPMAWRITDILLPGGPGAIDPNANAGESYLWFFHQDRAQVANNRGASNFTDGAPYITVENQSCSGAEANVPCIHYAQSPTAFGAAPSPNFIYFEADFRHAVLPVTYKTSTLRLEAFTL